MGSILTRDGKDMWDLPRAVGRLTTGRMSALALPPGLENAEPDPEHTLTPGPGLLREARVWPGFAPHLGYGGLLSFLEREVPERLAVFAYDWRLSNRLSAARLKVFVERRLAQWQERAAVQYPGEEKPRVVYLCHSMGGLVARYYIECLGGHETAETVVTIGTPYHGAPKAIRVLTGQMPWYVPNWLAERIRGVAGNFPSVAQLLPTYRVVRRLDNEAERLNTVSIPDLPTEAVRDAFDFHAEIEAARAARRDAARAAGSGTPGDPIALGGGTHSTEHAVSLSAGKLRFHDRLDDRADWFGDGTVPGISATPPELGDTGRTRWHPHRHTDLPNKRLVRDQLLKVCKALDLTDYLSDDVRIDLQAPDFVPLGSPLEVTATATDPILQIHARLSDSNGVAVAETELLPDGDGSHRGSMIAPEGVWTLEVRSDSPRITHRDAVLVTDA
ncbi:esterase/lipase family protein [Streptomyces sp. NPDC058691]|uniref:esterase/lipase family protein n=1 Tax=Streptomyces sp. NPDC058691 TaxID=3346601 RepID=UPI0036524DC2